jgi:cell division septation protein DedD
VTGSVDEAFAVDAASTADEVLTVEEALTAGADLRMALAAASAPGMASMVAA